MYEERRNGVDDAWEPLPRKILLSLSFSFLLSRLILPVRFATQFDDVHDH